MKDMETHIQAAVKLEISKIAEEVKLQMLEELDDLVDDDLIEAVAAKVEIKLQPLMAQLQEYLSQLNNKISDFEKSLNALDG